MRVLGIDPGYAIVGWGVVDYGGNRFAPVDFGAVCTDAGVPFERRLDEVYTGIKEVIERTRPEVLAIEKLFLLPFAPLEEVLEKRRRYYQATQNDSGRWVLTPQGYLVSNDIITDLLIAQDSSHPLKRI